jgi:hypothetical protein
MLAMLACLVGIVSDKVFGWCAKIKRLWSRYLLGFRQEQGIFCPPIGLAIAVPKLCQSLYSGALI